MASKADTGARPRTKAGLALTLAGASTAIAFGAPFAYLIIRSAQRPAAFAASLSPSQAGPLGRSLILAAAVCVAATGIGVAAAWLVEQTDVPAARLWRVVLPLPLVLPSFVAALAMQSAVAAGGVLEPVLRLAGLRGGRVEGFWAAFVVLTAITYPYVYLTAAARFRTLPPSTLEVARGLGRRPGSVLVSVAWPQVRPAAVAGLLLVFLYVVSDFGAVQILRYDTLTRAVYSKRLLDQPLALAFALQLGIVAVAATGAERIFAARAGRTPPAVGARRVTMRLGRGRWTAAGALAAIVAVSLATPCGVLGVLAARGIRAGAAGRVLDGLPGPSWSTAWAGCIAAVVAVATVLPLAVLTTRRRTVVGSAASVVVVAGFALPGLATALAIVFFVLGGPGWLAGAYQTHVLLVFAYVVHFGALALRAAQSGLAARPQRLDEAARALGAGRWRRLATVDVPLAAPGLAAGAGLVLLSVMKELPATLLLAPAGFRTLATRIWTLAEEAFWTRASLASLVLVVLSAALSWALVIRRGDVV